MSTSEVVCYLAAWGIIGSALFSLFVIFVFRTGVVYNARDEDGLLKEKIPIQGYLASIGFLVLIVFFSGHGELFWIDSEKIPFEFW